jgi:hypothetical protein
MHWRHASGNGKAWIERKSRLHRGPRLIQLPEQRESSSEMEMRERVIPVCLDASAQPGDCFSIGVEMQLGDADPYHPLRSKGVARRKAKRLLDVTFGFCASTKEIFGVPNETMGQG